MRSIAASAVASARRPHRMILAALLLAAIGLPGAASARDTLTCKLKFSMSGWSVFYKTSSGRGTISCSNGQSASVKISAKGGGLTVGKSRIDHGTGEFAGVHNLNDTLGSYATAEAHAGASKSSKAQVMTKGDVSLALAGTGQGWDLGVAFGKFTISR